MKTGSTYLLIKRLPFISSLILLACTSYTPPQPKPNIDLEAEWQFANFASQNKTVDHSRWWQNLNDQHFNQILDFALKNNRDIATSYAQLLVLRTQLSGQDANLLPSVSSSTGAQRTIAHEQRPRNNFSLGVQASWDLDLWGQTKDGIDAAKLGIGEQKLLTENAKVSLAAELAHTYVNWHLAQARLNLNSQMVAARAQLLQIAKWRKEAGVTSNVDVLQAQNAYEAMLSNRPNLMQNKENLEAQLQLLMGGGKLARELIATNLANQTTNATTNATTSKANTPQKSWPPSQLKTRKPTVSKGVVEQMPDTGYIPQFNQSIIINAPASVLNARPDVAQKEFALKRQWLLWQQATKERLPNLKLSGSINNSELTFGKLLQLRSIVAQLAANLTAPIWDAGRIDSQVAQQNAQFEVARLSYEKTVLQAINEVESALVSQHYSADALSQTNKQLTITKQLAKLSEQQYKSGLSDMTALLTNLNSEYTASENALSAKANVTLAGINLYKSIGAGWENIAFRSQVSDARLNLDASTKTDPQINQTYNDESIENLINWAQQSD